jgi:hypothetical protein
MLASPAWRAMTMNARRVLDRVILESMGHAGTQNAALRLTYEDFLTAGLPSRNAVAEGIRVAEALGFLDVPIRGRRSYGGARLASCYGLTWLENEHGERAANRWKLIKTDEQAAFAVAVAAQPTHRQRRSPRTSVSAVPATA